MPMPNAFVATATSAFFEMNFVCRDSRSLSSSPPWYSITLIFHDRSSSPTSSTRLRVEQ